MNIEFLPGVPSTNFAVGRDGNTVNLIVDHWMAGSFDAALARFRNPASIVSAHFLIGTDGRIAQVVSTDDTAYHAGDWDTNLRSIGIEHEASPTVTPSDALYVSSAWLHRELARIYGLTLDGTTVRPHRDFANTACPGTLDLARVVALANEEDDLSLREEFEAYKKETDATIKAMKDAYDPLYHHKHGAPGLTSEPFVPPVEGADLNSMSPDFKTLIWIYPDGTHHTWIDGVEVRP